MLRVLGRDSSINVRKVLWTCAEIGLPFEREDWGAGFQPTNDPAFIALNPNALIPVVIASGNPGPDFVLWESNTICRWLASEHRRSDLLPTQPRERALVERWMDWQATELNTAWRYAFMALVRHSAAHQDSTAIQHSLAEWNRLMHLLDAQLQTTHAFVAGASFSLADVVLGLSTHRWLATPQSAAMRPELHAVVAYNQRLSLRPGFVAYGRNGHP